MKTHESGKSSTQAIPEGVRRTHQGKEMPPRSQRKRLHNFFAMPHDRDGRLVRQ